MLHIKEFTVLTSLQTAEKRLRNEVSRWTATIGISM